MFKKLADYPLFKISEKGEVISLIHARPVKKFVNGRSLVINLIDKDGRRKIVPLLPLVLEYFCNPEEYKGKNVGYLDGNPFNLSVKNLFFTFEDVEVNFAVRANIKVEAIQASPTGKFVVFNLDTHAEYLIDKLDYLVLAVQSGKTALMRQVEINSEATCTDDLLPTVDYEGVQWVVMNTLDFHRLVNNVKSVTPLPTTPGPALASVVDPQSEYDDEQDVPLEIV